MPTTPLQTDGVGDIARYLQHLHVERLLAARTLAMYADALRRLSDFAAAYPVPLRQVQAQHVRRWAAQRHAQGLAPGSIALELSAWRGLYRWLGRDGVVPLNPVDGVRAPRAHVIETCHTMSDGKTTCWRRV